MDEGLVFLRRMVRESADRLDVLLRRLEHHVERPSDPRLPPWARPFLPSLARELDSLRAYAEALGTSAPSGLSRSVAGALGDAATAVLGGGPADAWDDLMPTIAAARDVRERLRGFAAAGRKLQNERLSEIDATLGPELRRLLDGGEQILESLFVERARPAAAAR